MPGKHAPPTPSSFYASLARAGLGAMAALGLVVAIVLIAVSARDDGTDPNLAGTPLPSESRSSEPTTEPAPTDEPSEPPATEPLVARSKLQLDVLNGAGREGLAARTENRLRSRGYRRIEIDNASPTTRTTIYFRGSLRREAERLLKDFPDLKRVRPARSSTPGAAQITIVLGADHREN